MPNQKCLDLDCPQGCCNVFGNCPQSNPHYEGTIIHDMLFNCKYYYNDSTGTHLNIGALVGGVIGGTFVLFVVVMVICICMRRKTGMKDEQTITNHQTGTGQVIIRDQRPQFYSYPSSQPYSQPYFQPYPRQPEQYGQPYLTNSIQNNKYSGQNSLPIHIYPQPNNRPFGRNF